MSQTNQSKTDASLTSFLVSRGLFAIGSSETIEDLRQKYGTNHRFDSHEIIPLPPASLFPEQVEPFYVRLDRNALLPPALFECDFKAHSDGMQNYNLALSRLTDNFGAPTNGPSWASFSAEWQFESMRLTLWVYLEGENPFKATKDTAQRLLYEQVPELWNLCHIWILRVPTRFMTQAEADRLNALVPSQILPVDPSLLDDKSATAGWPFRHVSDRIALESRQAPFLWKDRDGIGEFFASGMIMFERQPSMRLGLERMMPGKGGPYSGLSLTVPSPYTLEYQELSWGLLSGDELDSLDALAEQISRFWELPLEVKTGFAL